MMPTKNMSMGFGYLCVAFLVSIFVRVPLLTYPSATFAQAYTIYDPKPANAVEARVLRVSIVCRDVDGTSKLWAKALSLPAPEILISTRPAAQADSAPPGAQSLAIRPTIN
jgi:hypothetical protein